MKYIFYLPFLLLYLTVFSQAQTNVSTIQKGNKTLVRVPVVVSDREGRRIAGLKREDFSVFQEGVKQEIVSFGTDDEPVSVALLLDTSGSTQNVLDNIKDAAKDFIDLLNPDDQCLIATFDSRTNILISFTSEHESLKNSLNKIETAEKDGTIMYSTIDQIIQNSFKRVKGRKAIVLLSDGKDYGSTITKNDLLSELNESDVAVSTVYYQSGIGFNKPLLNNDGTIIEGKEETKPKKQPKPKKRKNVYTVLIPLPDDGLSPEEIKVVDKTETTNAIGTLREISSLTAGRFYLSDPGKLNTIFKQVAAELRQQYFLTFYTESGKDKNSIRGIKVKIDRPNLVVQTPTKLTVKE